MILSKEFKPQVAPEEFSLQKAYLGLLYNSQIIIVRWLLKSAQHISKRQNAFREYYTLTDSWKQKNVPYDKHLSMYTMCSFAKAFSSKIIFVRLRIPQPLSQTQV